MLELFLILFHGLRIVEMNPSDRSQVCESISRKLASLTTENSRSFIFKLHNQLRNVNDKAYEPEIITIGPYHRGKDNLKLMEEHKLHYLKSLLENVNIDAYVTAIAGMEQEARNSYAEPICLDAAKFTEMLVLDGCFIIELVRKYSREQLIKTDDPIFRRGWMMNSLKRDLMLFENQIPFFILCKLFDLIEVPNNHNKLIRLALIFFSDMFPGHEGCELSVRKSSNHEIKHLLELIHIGWDWHPHPITMLDMDDNSMSTQRTCRFINSATELRKANVKFKKSESSLFDIRFENGCLLLPPLIIHDGTESIFRNLIAYEQYFGRVGYVTDYIRFIDCLINSSADVEILIYHGIIDNWLGDAEVVSNMIGKLGDSVSCSGPNFSHSKIFERVNVHCERRRNRWMASLKHHHLSSPWAIMSIFAAIVLLLLTATQTVFSILK